MTKEEAEEKMCPYRGYSEVDRHEDVWRVDAPCITTKCLMWIVLDDHERDERGNYTGEIDPIAKGRCGLIK